MRTSDSSNHPFALKSNTMPARNPYPPSDKPVTESPGPRGKNSPAIEESSIEYVGRREPRVPLPVVFFGLVAVAAAIVAFLHFSQP
jgi:hypothetical protein